jgi:hypothetical protein
MSGRWEMLDLDSDLSAMHVPLRSQVATNDSSRARSTR